MSRQPASTWPHSRRFCGRIASGIAAGARRVVLKENFLGRLSAGRATICGLDRFCVTFLAPGSTATATLQLGAGNLQLATNTAVIWEHDDLLWSAGFYERSEMNSTRLTAKDSLTNQPQPTYCFRLRRWASWRPATVFWRLLGGIPSWACTRPRPCTSGFKMFTPRLWVRLMPKAIRRRLTSGPTWLYWRDISPPCETCERMKATSQGVDVVSR